MKKVLFVLGGLHMGGVETYIVRLAKELNACGCEVDVLIISKQYDSGLISEISKFTNIFIHENASFLKASSWINAFLPLKWEGERACYDVVHVVDLLTLGFVFLNRNVIKFKALSIGIYHSMEMYWWRNKGAYFRSKLLELYDSNVSLTLFPSESVAIMASELTGVAIDDMDILPLGIELSKYSNCAPSFSSRKIVSVGRLVDFKVYNRHLISQLSELRKLAEFEYYIYGEGPELDALQKHAVECDVDRYVHFMGGVKYKDLPSVLDGIFCFVGSGTTIIEASAAGVPSLVGIESIKQPLTCGLFSDVEGYSYNEESATTRRLSFVDAVNEIYQLNESEYAYLARCHRTKSSCFDIKITAVEFLKKSNKLPNFSFKFNRWLAILSFVYSVFRFGPRALKSRFESGKD
ncbi:glycosyltransferase family 4 protein [Pseudomonas sp. Ga0074129]|uniref:glycosyltransferase family 4 protein n=1 Tax=Pseudomonas sp. Ga0074129 TaxID=1752219 RepID=UPI000A8A9E7A|nr:glycosyltransferase family 4 protein [Pseudomonas sp. Ga0074129]